MPGPDLEPLPEMPAEEVNRLRVEYAVHTSVPGNTRHCRCGRDNPCERRREIYLQLVASGNPPAGP